MTRSLVRSLAASLTLALSLALAAGCGASASSAGAGRTTGAGGTTATITAPGSEQVRIVGDFDPLTGRLRADPVADAYERMLDGDLTGARAQLERVVAGMPADWTPVRRTARGLEIAAWSFGDLLPHSLMVAAAGTSTDIYWVAPSYSRAYLLLGSIAVEDKDLARAADLLDRGLALEAHPQLQTERALVMAHTGDLPGALALYVAASESTVGTDADRARAWRGRGAVLIDLGQLDEAEQAYRRSLELEPEQKLALSELEYIRQLRAGEIQPQQPTIVR